MPPKQKLNAARKRASGPTQTEADRLARGRVQLKVRISAEARAQLDALTAASGLDLSSEVEQMIGDAWQKRYGRRLK